ncbi:MFS transporter [Microterricola viridarii]|uniref:Multidrug efflux pump Tap n=1 Tax=Microterricola viridarii TaxID=412690 RepID=A0A1H1Z3F6_9MICO|nr:MFS transporter [Microterricola viridarii]SDT28345.1 Major Facilitator Superfamily protein [Microterricola viridarii]
MPSRAPERPRTRAGALPLLAVLVAAFVSRAGNAITAIAVPLYVFADTGSALATGTAGVFATLPVVIGGSLGGALIDRLGYRLSSIAADLASGLTVLALPILAATTGLPFWLLLLLVFLSGLLDAPGDTAKTVMLPELAERAAVPLARAAGAQAAVQRSASMVGAALAGMLIGVVGAPGALYVNAATFAVSAVLVAALIPRMRRAEASAAAPVAADGMPDGEPDGYWRGFAAGLRFLWSNALLRGIVLLVMLTNAIDTAGLTVIFPVYATERLGSASALGFLVASFMGGALLGAVVFAAVGHRVAGRGLFVLFFVLAGLPPYLAMAFEVPFPVLLGVLAFSGLAAGGINPMVSTALFGLIPAPMRARVFGSMTAGVAAAMPLGAFLGGVGVTALGLQPTLLIAAGVYALAALSPLFGQHWRGLAALPQAAPAERA